MSRDLNKAASGLTLALVIELLTERPDVFEVICDDQDVAGHFTDLVADAIGEVAAAEGDEGTAKQVWHRVVGDVIALAPVTS